MIYRHIKVLSHHTIFRPILNAFASAIKKIKWLSLTCYSMLKWFFISFIILTIPFSSDCLMEIRHQLILKRCFNLTFVFKQYNICWKEKLEWKIVSCDRTLIQILLVYHLPTSPPKTASTFTNKMKCSFT